MLKSGAHLFQGHLLRMNEVGAETGDVWEAKDWNRCLIKCKRKLLGKS